MGSIIIAMPNRDNALMIAGKLNSHGLMVSDIFTRGAEVLGTAHVRNPGLIICQPKFKDMGYLELLEYLPDYFDMLLLTKSEADDYENDERMVKLAMPFKTVDLVNTVDMIISRQYQKYGKPKKKGKTRSYEDQKIINQAKHILMERNNMTEPEAFRYIQKCSMDTSRTMLESAQMILTLYI